MTGMSKGTMMKAVAFRVKYRKYDSFGNVLRERTEVRRFGTHQGNRSGVYPAGVRCQGLCHDVFYTGFVKEEVDHMCIAVEEVPHDHVLSRGKDWVSGLKYNQSKCADDALLMECYLPPNDKADRLLLSHNHIMLVCRAFQAKAQWNLPAITEKKLVFCDGDGRLSITAVAAHANGVQFAQMMIDGVMCEVLSFKIDIEEPGAAAIISLACNTGNAMAMRTTELTAMAELSGEVIRQNAENNLGQEIRFAAVLQAVREKLETAAADPDLVEVFDFLIKLGVATTANDEKQNSYVPELLEFGAIFVDGKKRQLRLAAFGVTNKMRDDEPLSKVAVLKRAYRSKPTFGFCPSPEVEWTADKTTSGVMQKLEQMLRFFHVERKPFIDKLPPQSRPEVKANLDVAAATAFLTAKTKKNATLQDIEAALIASTREYADQLNMKGADRESAHSIWVKFTAVADKSTAVADAPTAAHVVPIRFNELTGECINQQVDFDIAKKKVAEVAKILPWRDWCLNNPAMGEVEADKCAAVAMLGNLRAAMDDTTQPIDVLSCNDKVSVVARTVGHVAAGRIQLAPCVPKTMRVLGHSDHPHKIMVEMVVRKPYQGLPDEETLLSAVNKMNNEGPVLRTKWFAVTPEFKSPKQADGPDSAVAGPPPPWLWSDTDTMHPFWAIRRLTDAQLAKENQAVKPGAPALRFNCELKSFPFQSVNIAVIGATVTNLTRLFNVPLLVNNLDLLPEEELLLRIEGKIAKDKRAPTWRDDEEVKHMVADARKRGAATARSSGRDPKQARTEQDR